MKTFTAATLLLLSAVSASPVPADVEARVPTPKFNILPVALASHDVNTGANTLGTATTTKRKGNVETSTLYQVTFPASVAGLTCAGRFHSGRSTDSVEGTGNLDFFDTMITQPLANQKYGNLRNTALGRLDWAGVGNDFVIDPTITFPGAKGFPCPAGKTIVVESVAVGTTDVVNVAQDFAASWTPAAGTPSGFSFIAF